MIRLRALGGLFLLAPLSSAVFWIAVATAGTTWTTAAATMVDLEGRTVGRVSFVQVGGSETKVRYSLRGLPGGFHGFHIHAGASCDPTRRFARSDGHYDHAGRLHPFDGDMPVVLVRHDRRAAGSFVTDRFRIDDVIDMTVIVHQRPDNYANVPVGSRRNDYRPNARNTRATTDRTGNAGRRIACGVIRPTG